MVVLGLGSNVGDRLAHLRAAFKLLSKLSGVFINQVSPLYLSDALLPENAPLDWDMPHLNLALRCDTTLEPLALLNELKKIEALIGRKPEIRHWGPRMIDIDILAWDDLVIDNERLSIPHRGLAERPFALWPLADVAPFWTFPISHSQQGKTAAEVVEQWGSRFSGEAPLRTRQINQRIDTPMLVGIINVTPDSFSDGGCFLAAEKALAQALQLIDAGAEMLDIGAEATGPNAHPLSPEVEWERLQPVLIALESARENFIIPPKISVDTRHPATASKALQFPIDVINDVTGLQNPAMQNIIADATVDCMMMHHLSIPPKRQQILPRNQDPVIFIHDWAQQQLENLERRGISRERIILDPGIGYGKAAEQSLALIKATPAFKNLGTRLLIGHSRKSFLSLFTPHASSARDIETLAISLYLAKQSVDYLRIHQVEMCARALKVQCSLNPS